MADPARKRPADRGARSNRGHLGPPRAVPRPPARPPPGPRPRRPLPGVAQLTPNTRAHTGSTVLLNLLAVSFQQPSQHDLETGAAPGPAGARPPLASALGRR